MRPDDHRDTDRPVVRVDHGPSDHREGGGSDRRPHPARIPVRLSRAGLSLLLLLALGGGLGTADRLCGVVAPEEALQAFTFGGPDDDGADIGGSAFRVWLLNQSRLPQRLLGVDSPLGDAPLLRDGVRVGLPLTVPAGGSTAGTFPLGGTTAPQSFSLPVTIALACGSPRVTGLDDTVYLTFDAGPGTPRQQARVEGSFGRC